jgi:hypothetical protein
MSVVYGDRGLSNTQYWKELLALERDFRLYLLRDFGVKRRTREPEWYIHTLRMTPDHARQFRDLCAEYGVEKITDRFPEWLVDDMRHDILDVLRRLKRNIRDAYDVYPYYVSEYFKRRNYQDDAIRNCGELYDIFTTCKDTFPINADLYDQYVEKIEHVCDLLKAWRKLENPILKQIREREAKAAVDLAKKVSTGNPG